MNSNSLWYLGLAILSLLLIVFVWVKSKTYRSLLMFILMSSVAYVIDSVNYTFLGCYQFYPEFIQKSEYYDSNLGGMVSNLLALPAVATLIAVFRFSWATILAITGLFVGIEWLFLKLDLYRHNWWKLSYTAIGLPFYFALARAWFQKLMLPLRGFLHFVTLYLITAALIGNVQIMIPTIILGNRIYQIGWFNDPYRDSSAFATVFWLSYTLLFTLTLKLRWERKWVKYLCLIAILYLVVTILQKTGIQQSYVWWDEWYCISITFALLFVAEALNKRLWNGPAKTRLQSNK